MIIVDRRDNWYYRAFRHCLKVSGMTSKQQIWGLELTYNEFNVVAPSKADVIEFCWDRLYSPTLRWDILNKWSGT